MKETLKAYLAGILDADGYFTIKRSTYHMRVRGDATQAVFSEKVGLKQVKPEAVDLLKEHFGGTRRMEKSSAKRGQPLHVWQVTDRKAATVAKTLLPYLILKRQQAELLLELRHSKENDKREFTGVVHEFPNRWGGITRRRQKLMPRHVIEKREDLVIAVKKLNDTRNTQPRLI